MNEEEHLRAAIRTTLFMVVAAFGLLVGVATGGVVLPTARASDATTWQDRTSGVDWKVPPARMDFAKVYQHRMAEFKAQEGKNDIVQEKPAPRLAAFTPRPEDHVERRPTHAAGAHAHHYHHWHRHYAHHRRRAAD
jgi:hypothetical protein